MQFELLPAKTSSVASCKIIKNILLLVVTNRKTFQQEGQSEFFCVKTQMHHQL